MYLSKSNLLRLLLIFNIIGIVACRTVQSNSTTSSTAKTVQLKILTYNAYLLHHIGLNNYLTQRSAELPIRLNSTGADIIFLQEIWQKEFDHPAYIIDAMNKFGYNAIFYDAKSDSTPYGSGLLILVKSPISIEDQNFIPWDLTNVTSERERESLKGILTAGIYVPGLGNLQIFNSHTSAQTFDSNLMSYLPSSQARDQQILLLHDTMQHYRKQNNYCQLIGIDLNTHFRDWDSTQKSFAGNLNKDVLMLRNSLDMEPDIKIDDVDYKDSSYITWDSKNYWVKSGLFPDNPSSKIDYVFYQKSKIVKDERYTCAYNSTSARVFTENDVSIQTSLVKNGEKISLKTPLSDHYGVLVDVAFRSSLEN